MRCLTNVVVAALCVALAGPPAAAERPGARVVELFTSHGCSSCPQADRLLGELIEADPSLVALEYHVDYWNSLVHGSAGSFVDPFSDPVWSLRQRDYDGLALDGRAGIYTPQVIVDGRFAAVGSDGARIRWALAGEATAVPDIAIERDGDAFVVRVVGVEVGERERRTAGHLPAPSPDTGEVALVRFLHEGRTLITGGENRGLELVNRRIVTAVEPLGRVGADGSLTVRTAVPDDPAQGCAVLVRHGAGSSRLAARLCPGPA